MATTLGTEEFSSGFLWAVKSQPQQRYYLTMEHTNNIIGYRVLHPSNETFVHEDVNGCYLDSVEPEPLKSHAAAIHLMADAMDDLDIPANMFSVEPVYRELTPVESTARELGDLLVNLCNRHGLELGLNREQIDATLARELEEFRAVGKLFNK